MAVEMESYLIVPQPSIEKILKCSSLQYEFMVIIMHFIMIVTVIWWMMYFKTEIILYFENNLDKVQSIIPIKDYTHCCNILYCLIFIHCKKCNIVYQYTNLLHFDALILLIMKYLKKLFIVIISTIFNINNVNQEKCGIFDKQKHGL